MCWQYDVQLGTPVTGSEDCLYLNLFRPKLQEKKQLLDVIVFVHGGGFYSGTNNPALYGPDYFMETGQVILVTITYRVNVFGFLATGDEAAPGNYGLKDQTMALRWIRDNVAAFGGNPEAVTLMGHSAGSVSAHYHLLSPQSKGLFRNVILLAGVANSEWGLPMKSPRELVNRHARALGILSPEKMSSQELVERFRDIPAKDLLEAIKKLKDWDILPITSYLPAIESPSSDAFLTESPEDLMERGEFTKVPVLASILPFDAINFIQPFLTPAEKYKELNENVYEILPITLYMDGNNTKIREIVDRVRYKYFGPTGKIENDAALDNLQRMATDYFFGKPLYWTMQQLAKNSDKPAFGFQWFYKGRNSLAPLFTGQTTRKYNTSHVDELLHLFRVRMVFPDQLNEDDEKAKNSLMKLILDFAKTGDSGFEKWEVTDPKMARFRNDNTTTIAREIVSLKDDVKDLEFWDEIRKMYTEGQKKGAV